jgi:hypothetical protein
MSIRRAKPSEEAVKAAVATVDKKLSAELKEATALKKQRGEYFNALTAPFRQLIERDEKAHAALKALQSSAKQEKERHGHGFKNRGKSGPIRPLLTTNPGLNFAIPPYDADWTSTPVWSQADKTAGTFSVSPLDSSGFAAAAVGVFLTSNQNTNARFSADVPFSYSWADWAINGGTAASDGGIGVLIYQGADVIVDVRVALWNDSQTFPSPAAYGSGDTYLVWTQAGQIYFPMSANTSYLAWVWCWGSAYIDGSSDFAGGNITCNMPFIVVEDT